MTFRRSPLAALLDRNTSVVVSIAVIMITMKSFKLLSCMLYALICSGTVTANLTITSGSLNGTVFESAQLYKKGIKLFIMIAYHNDIMLGDDFSSRFSTFSGNLILASNPVLENSIVYLEKQPGQLFYAKVFELQDQGIIGIVYATPTSKIRYYPSTKYFQI